MAASAPADTGASGSEQPERALLLRGGMRGQRAPVQGGVSPQRVDADVLLHEAVQQDREGGEADVVQGQIGRVV